MIHDYRNSGKYDYTGYRVFQKMNKSCNCTYCDKKFQQKVSQNRHEGQCLKRKKSSKWQENSIEYEAQNTSIEEKNIKGQLNSE